MTAAATPELFSTLLGALQYQAIAYKATERPARYREHPCPIFRFSALRGPPRFSAGMRSARSSRRTSQSSRSIRRTSSRGNPKPRSRRTRDPQQPAADMRWLPAGAQPDGLGELTDPHRHSLPPCGPFGRSGLWIRAPRAQLRTSGLVRAGARRSGRAEVGRGRGWREGFALRRTYPNWV